MKKKWLFVTVILGLSLTWTLLWILGSQGLPAVAAPGAGPVEGASALAAELHVCSSGCGYSSVQAAVDAASEEDIIKLCSEKLSRYKLPKKVEYIDVLPRNPAGKILKRILRDQFA